MEFRFGVGLWPPLAIAVVIGVCLALAGAGPTPAAAAGLMTWPDLLRRPMPVATERIAYGADPLQFAELWLPAGPGPHPLVVMAHGGCWESRVAKTSIMNYLAEDLRRRGVAVWNLEYRGVDRPGGGYPGTFLDVADGADAGRRVARARHLDLTRVVVVGHSAGGHLALWLAARGGLKPESPLYRRHPLAIATAISLGGLPDLAAAMTPPTDTCGDEAPARLVGEAKPGRPSVYADTSPPEMAPPKARVVLVNADQDPIAPPGFAAAYVARVSARGPAPETHVITGEGHVELIAPGSHAWEVERGLIEAALGRGPVSAKP